MKTQSHIKSILGVAILGMATLSGQSFADQGITIDQQSSTKAVLAPVGKSDAETTVYTDTNGLAPKPAFKEIQDNPNFIADEQRFVAKQTVSPQPAPKPEVTKAEEEFSFYDKSQNGFLDHDEFFLFELSSDAQKIFESVDRNDDDVISFSEFKVYFKEKQG